MRQAHALKQKQSRELWQPPRLHPAWSRGDGPVGPWEKVGARREARKQAEGEEEEAPWRGHGVWSAPTEPLSVSPARQGHCGKDVTRWGGERLVTPPGVAQEKLTTQPTTLQSSDRSVDPTGGAVCCGHQPARRSAERAPTPGARLSWACQQHQERGQWLRGTGEEGWPEARRPTASEQCWGAVVSPRPHGQLAEALPRACELWKLLSCPGGPSGQWWSWLSVLTPHTSFWWPPTAQSSILPTCLRGMLTSGISSICYVLQIHIKTLLPKYSGVRRWDLVAIRRVTGVEHAWKGSEPFPESRERWFPRSALYHVRTQEVSGLQPEEGSHQILDRAGTLVLDYCLQKCEK